MENVSRKREIYHSIESTQANKERKKSPDQNGRDIVHSGLVQETLQNIKIQVLDKELDVKYVKNVENEQLIEKIKAHAQFITANKEVLPFPKSDDVKQIFVSDITVETKPPTNETGTTKTCTLKIKLKVGKKHVKIVFELSANNLKERYLKVGASLREINKLYIKLNALFEDKGSVNLSADLDDKLEVDIDALAISILNCMAYNRHVKIKNQNFFFTKNLEHIFCIQKALGKGSEASVYQVVDILNPSENRIKALRTVKYRVGGEEEFLPGIENGSNILQFLHKANGNKPISGIQQLIEGVTLVEQTAQFKRFFTISDLAYGCLFRYAIEEKKFQFEEMPRRIAFLKELLDGVEFSHKNGIIHGDLKPGNILVYLNEKGLVSRLVICDWDGATSDNDLAPTGTATYIPYTNGGDYKRNDVFAISKTMAEALNQELLDLEEHTYIEAKPFNENSQERQMQLRTEFKSNNVPDNIVTALIKGLSTPIPSITTLKESFQLHAF